MGPKTSSEIGCEGGVPAGIACIFSVCCLRVAVLSGWRYRTLLVSDESLCIAAMLPAVMKEL